MQLTLTDIRFTYPSSARPVLDGVNVTFQTGWTGIVGDNGCGKTTLAKIALGMLPPDSGSVSPTLLGALCEQDVSVPPGQLEDFGCAWDGLAVRLRSMLGIDDEWAWRYDELSCGQRKRLQVAVALWLQPDVLVMDEPTNHVDAPTRGKILSALEAYPGIGLLISHDRDLLDALASHCLMFEPGGPRMRKGTYTQAEGQHAADVASAREQRSEARREERRLAAERQRRVEEASRADKLRSKSGLSGGDHDSRERIGRAVATGKDARATHLARTMGTRAETARERTSSVFVEHRYDGDVPDFGERSRRPVLVRLEEQMLPFASGTSDDASEESPSGVELQALAIGSGDHVGIVGPNGSGKSTLVRAIIRAVPDDVETIYIPQEIDEEQGSAVIARLRALPPGDRGRVLSVVAQLNSKPEGLLDTGKVSPGELRKLMVAEGVLGSPQLLVMDEPTNHLDLHSVEALERFLGRFPGALVLVSHDLRAVEASCNRIWTLTIEDRPSASISRIVMA